MKKIYLIIGILIIVLSSVGLKNYSDTLRKESWTELYNSKNRTAAIEKIRLAQTVWPFLRFDKPYQNLLTELNGIERASAIVIFFKTDSSKSDLDNLVSELQLIQGVKKVNFVSQEEALMIYKEQNKTDPALLELVTADILPASIEVFLDDFTIRSQIENLAKSKPFVTEVIQSI